jgi:glycosyltransferase involved in cell wall biosynthesis
MMNVALIIPLYKQSQYWTKILAGIESQSRQADKIVIVMDRPGEDLGDGSDPTWDARRHVDELNQQSCIDYSKFTILTPTIPKIGRNTQGQRFFAGHMRNQGIRYAYENGMDVFVLIDGDCIPQSRLIEGHCSKCEHNNPVLSVGRRRESTFNWKDRREVDPNLIRYGFFRANGIMVQDPELLRQALIVWSCNMALNMAAVERLYAFNLRYYQREKEAFCGEFTGMWGGEDTFMGIQAWHCKLFIVTTGLKKAGVMHIDHPRPKDIYNVDHMEFVNNHKELLHKKVTLNPLDLAFFEPNASS